ncbi:MAG: peroxiredoxin-like family protein [Bacteroidales bacterium]
MLRNTFLTILISISFTLAAQKELPLGSKAPAINAVSYNGDKLDLNAMLKKGPVIINFTRGEWCGHCVRQLSNLEDSLHYLQAFSAQVIGVTPESNENISTTIEKTNASFHIIYDHDRKIMEDYHVKWQLSSFMHAVYRIGGININKASGADDRALPVPATYIVDRSGTIVGSFYDEDHSRRMWVKDMIEVLRKL